MRINYRERHRRIRDAEIEAWNSSYNVERDPGLRDAYPNLPRAPIRLICCPLVKDVNQGGMLRLAEAFRAERVVFSPEKDNAVDFSGRRGTDIWQPHEWKPAYEAVPEAKAAGYMTVALTISPRAIPLEEVPWTFPLALIIGEEKFGISSDIEEMCDVSAAIPVYGIVQSLNVTTATAIALHAATSAYRKKDSTFQPARNASRKLLRLPEISYESEP